MRSFSKKLLSLSLALLMLFSAVTAGAGAGLTVNAAEERTYISAEKLEAGENYIIAVKSGDKYYAISTNKCSADYLSGIEIELSDNESKVITTENKIDWQASEGKNGIRLYNNGYLTRESGLINDKTYLAEEPHEKRSEWNLSEYSNLYAYDEYGFMQSIGFYEDHACFRTGVYGSQLMLFKYVEPITVTEIEVTAKPEKINYIIGEKLDLTGAKVKITYSDGTVKEIEAEDFAEYKIITDPENGSELVSDGDIKVNFTAGEKTADITIVVSPAQETEIKAQAIEVTAQPDKTEYIVGEKLDLAGVTVKVTYDDGSIEEFGIEKFEEKGVSASPANGAEMTESGSITVTFTVGEKSASATVNVVNKETERDTVRISGDDRYQTAAAISSAGWETADTVIIASGMDFADALAGAPLSYAVNAPILLTAGDLAEQDVIEEIKRLGAKNAYILGGENAVSANAQKVLESMEINVMRLGGKTRLETSVSIAEQLAKISGKAEQAFIVNGYNYPDALSVSPVAALLGSPIFYVDAQGSVDENTAQFIKNNEIGKIRAIGGEEAVPAEAMGQLEKLGVGTDRIGGEDRYETSFMIAENFDMLFTGEGITVATGLNFPDALSGSAFAAKNKMPILLTDEKLSDDMQNFVKSSNPSVVYVFGGKNAVSDDIVNAIKTA